MPTPMRRRLRLARRGAWQAIAVMLVAVALLIAVFSQALPLAERHPERIAAWLSGKAGHPVAFDALETTWTRRGPLLRLDGLRIGTGADAGKPHGGEGEGVRIGEAEVLVSIYSGLFPGRALTELRLRGLSLELHRADDGIWSVQGLPGQQSGIDPFKALEGLGELQVIGGSLGIHAPGLGWETRLPQVDLRVRANGPRLQVGARVRASPGGEPMRAALDFDRLRGDGRAWMQGNPIDLADWSALLAFGGVRVEGGQGQSQTWLDLQQHRITRAVSELQLRQLALHRDAAGSAQRVVFEQVDGRVQWKSREGGWRFDAPRLRIAMQPDAAGGGSRDRQTLALDGLLLAGGQDYALQAERIQAAPLFAVVALSDFVDPEMRRWLAGAKPEAQISNLHLHGRAGGGFQASGHLDGIRFEPMGDMPGVTGMAGDLAGDAHGFMLKLDPQVPLRFDWPTGFDSTHDALLDGQVVAWREEAGWRVATPRLQVTEPDYVAQLRGGAWFQGDGSRPWLDLAVALDQAPLAEVRRFWIRERMPAAVIRWLDEALLQGRIRSGSARFTGDLDDWPFSAGEGSVAASVRIEEGRVRFLKDWPVFENMQADVEFAGNAISATGSGVLQGIPVERFEAGIADFAESDVRVRGQASADAAQFLDLLRIEPLKKRFDEALAGLSASGPARAELELLQPLRAGNAERRRLQGKVQLQGVDATASRWDLAFEQARGSLAFNQAGLLAEGLSVRQGGQAGKLSLRAGTSAKEAGNAFEVEIDAPYTGGELLDRVPALAWLKPYVGGRSDWRIAVTVPAGQAPGAAAAQLRLRSNLRGTQLRLPAPLAKDADESLLTTMSVPLPVTAGLVDVAFGQRLALQMRNRNGKPGVRVSLGSARVTAPPPDEGLLVDGRAGLLDALGWAVFARGGASGEGGLPLRGMDVSADHLLAIGADFPDTRISLRPTDNGLSARLEGERLAGTVLIPAAANGRISGKLSRLHWRMPEAGLVPSRPGSGATQAQADPGAIPSLSFDIDELRLLDAQLGAASLRTLQTPKAMQITQLRLTPDPRQQIDISGSWSRPGSSSRTRLTADIDSQDVGGLFDALGMKGRMAGGNGKIQVQAGWSGGPADFSMTRLDGGLDMDLRDGRILQVEPGVGRVIGLFSVAQLPRRLMLDFGDFFNQGFAFNRINGRLSFDEGEAHSEGLSIDGPAADIHVRGSTDLRSQQFDQTIDVLPKSGNLLTVVGAVAGGPIGAAAGAVANAVLGKPLGEIGAKTYRVTGPWVDPQVDVEARGRESRQAPVDP